MRIRTPRFLAATAAAAAVALSLAAGAPAALADTTDVAPPGANDWSCVPSAVHPYPVVLVPGTFESMAKNWAVMSPILKNAGYCVYSLNYGTVDGVPASGPIEDSAVELGHFVDAVLGATGAKQVDLVGHSQGGMMPRYYIKFLGGTKTVHSLIGIAPSNHGTTSSPDPTSYVPSDGTSDPALSAASGAVTSVKPATASSSSSPSSTSSSDPSPTSAASEQAAGSAFLQKLNAGGDIQGKVFYTVIMTTHDEVVTPYYTEALSGPANQVTNVVIQNFCPLDPIEHDQTPNDPVVQQLVLAALGQNDGPLSTSYDPNCI